MSIELADPQGQLLAELGQPGIRQRDIASTYGLALRTKDRVDWPLVNLAIIDRWSVDGLTRIKAEAWKRHKAWLADDDPAPAHPHTSTGPDSCTCGAPGYTSALNCGHLAWAHGQPAPGGWMTCPRCQSQRRVAAFTAGPFPEVQQRAVTP